jgi:hypothetical protein
MNSSSSENSDNNFRNVGLLGAGVGLCLCLGASAKVPALLPLAWPEPLEQRKYDFFINHYQSGQDQCANLDKLLRAAGYTVWYDMKAQDLTARGMEQGVADSRNVMIFLSDGIMARRCCNAEQRWVRRGALFLFEEQRWIYSWEPRPWLGSRARRTGWAVVQDRSGRVGQRWIYSRSLGSDFRSLLPQPPFERPYTSPP